MQDLFSRAELFSLLQISDRAITKGLVQIDEAGLFSLSGRTLANGKPEKLYKFSDLPKKWQKRLTSPQTPLQNGEGLKSGDEIARNELNREVAGSEKRPTGNDENGQKSLAVMPDQLTRNITTKPLKEAHKQEQKQESDDPAAKAAVSGAVSAAPAAFQNPDLTPTLSSVARAKERGEGLNAAMNEVVRLGGTVKENTMISAVYDIENRKGSVKEAVEEVVRKYGVSRSTVYNWIRAVKGAKPQEENCQVLANSEVIDFKVESHTTCVDAIEYMVGTFLRNQRVTYSYIVEKTIEKAKENGWRIGTRGTLMRLLAQAASQIAPAIVIKRGGSTAFTKSVAPLTSRDLLKYDSLDVIVGDQHIFDFLVLDAKGNVVRPECYMFADMGSRFFLGFKGTLGHYNSNDVAAAFYDACRYGVPKAVYTDMGKPELSKHFEQLTKNMTGLTEFFDYSKIKIGNQIADETDEASGIIAKFETVEHKVAIGRRPVSKPIEGFFAIIEKWLYDETGGVGYTKRVADPDENLKIIAAAEKAKRQGKLLTYEEFFECVFRVFDRWNSHLISTDKIIPEERFFENLKQNPRPRIDERFLDFMILPEKIVHVRQSKIKLNGMEYYHPELSRYSSEFAKENRVLVKYHPDMPEKVYILDVRTKDFIAIPIIKNKINPKNPDEVAASMETQNHLRKMWTNFCKKYEPKGEDLSKKTRQIPMEKAAEKAERQEEVLRIVKENKKKVSQKDADLIFLGEAKKA